MYSTVSYPLTKEEFNCLLPVLPKSKLSMVGSTTSNDRYYFIGGSEDLGDALDRLKGLYDNYDEINPTIVYKCSFKHSLEPFRKKIQN